MRKNSLCYQFIYRTEKQIVRRRVNHLNNLKSEKLKTYSHATRFAVKATISVIKILARILVSAKRIEGLLMEIRDSQLSYRRTIDGKEAEQILGVSKNKLKAMRKSGTLSEGIHYRQDEAVIRYHPDLARLFIGHGFTNITCEVTDTATADSFADKQAAKQHTKNVFKNKGK